MDDAELLAQMIAAVKKSAAESGRDPESLRFVAQVFTSIADTDERAWELARQAPVGWLGVVGASIAGGAAWKKWGYEHPFGDFNWAKDMDITMVTDEQARELVAAVPDEILEHSCIWGSPERVANRLQPFVDAGINEISLFNFAAAGEPEHAVQWEAVASDVRQRLGCKPLALEPV
jgi:alkanesulfonate monooxygenase SsuD/methylene tetrahydromethanopterin reductase-like flavin-dependent oxidoreductase (luciferase family)